VNYGTPGVLPFVEHQPAVYPGGGLVGHNESYDPNWWLEPSTASDLAFSVVGVPEPCQTMILATASLLLWSVATRRTRVRPARVCSALGFALLTAAHASGVVTRRAASPAPPPSCLTAEMETGATFTPLGGMPQPRSFTAA
jgi:hypothetical protein